MGRRVGRFDDAFGPFGGDGIALFNRHAGILVKHLRPLAEVPHQEILEVVLAREKGCIESIGSSLRRIGGDFVDLDGFLPFSGDGVAFFHRHGGVLQEHLRPAAAAPREEVQEMVLAQGLGARRCVGVGLTVWCAAVDVMHSVPRVIHLSMPVGAAHFQGLSVGLDPSGFI